MSKAFYNIDPMVYMDYVLKEHTYRLDKFKEYANKKSTDTLTDNFARTHLFNQFFNSVSRYCGLQEIPTFNQKPLYVIKKEDTHDLVGQIEVNLNKDFLELTDEDTEIVKSIFTDYKKFILENGIELDMSSVTGIS